MIGNQVDPIGRAQREVRGLFADDGATSRAVAWADEVLEAEGIDPSAQQLRAIRALRRADRRLGLVAARYLLSLVTGGQEDPGGGSPRSQSPLLE